MYQWRNERWPMLYFPPKKQTQHLKKKKKVVALQIAWRPIYSSHKWSWDRGCRPETPTMVAKIYWDHSQQSVKNTNEVLSTGCPDSSPGTGGKPTEVWGLTNTWEESPEVVKLKGLHHMEFQSQCEETSKSLIGPIFPIGPVFPICPGDSF